MICALIDYIRICVFEIPVLKWLSNYEGKINRIVDKWNGVDKVDINQF